MRTNLALALAAAMTLTASPLLMAENVRTEELKIEDPWSRPTPPGAPMGAGYMVITNLSGEDLTLIAGETPKAGVVSIHETVEVDGLMRMQPLESGLAIPAGESVELKPLSYHLMLEQLNEPLAEGERVPLTLTFEALEPVELELLVRPLDGDEEDHDHHHH